MYNWSTLKKLIWLYAAKLKGGASAIIETITGNLPLALQNAIQHSIKSLTRYGLCTQDGTPTPSAPVDIMCNNGALKYGWQDVITTSQLSGYGTYVSPAQAAGNRAYRWFKDLPNGTYTFSVDGDYEIIVQWRDPADPADGLAQGYENLTGWITSGVVTLDKTSGGYGIAVRRTSGTDSITPSNFDGTLHVQEQGIYTDGTPEVLTVSENLYDDAEKVDEYYLTSDGNVSLKATGSSYSSAIPVTTGKRYTFTGISGKTGTNNKRIIAYASNATPSSVIKVGAAVSVAVSGKNVPYTVTIDLSDPQYGNAQYIRFSFNTEDKDIICVGEGVGQTASVPMLLSVGDVKDEVELISGTYTHRCAACEYDGTQDVGNTYLSTTGGKDIGAIIVYPLATPTTEHITGQNLVTNNGTNAVDSVANVSPLTAECVYMKAIDATSPIVGTGKAGYMKI